MAISRYALLFLLLSVFGCTQKKSEPQLNSELQQMEWLTGKWQQLHTDKRIFEEWTIANDSTLSGKNYVINSDDTLFLESIVIISIGGRVIYQPTVSNQNDGAPVSFTEHERSDNAISFENKTHDYPQRIDYRNPHNDTLLASIEGDYRKGYKRQEFVMVRRD